MALAEVPLFSAPLCLSGGAEGADQQWGMVAGSVGHTVIHWSFEGAHVHVPLEEVVRLKPDQLAEANLFLERANKTLGRKLRFNAQWIRLLQRNWFQVKDADSVYAVSSIKDGLVQGGTSWAVQMFLDRHDGSTCPCYVFDQEAERWFTWVREAVEIETPDDLLTSRQKVWEGRWQPIDAPPAPSGIYAAIGSRKLLKAGKNAIRCLLGYDPPSSPLA